MLYSRDYRTADLATFAGAKADVASPGVLFKTINDRFRVKLLDDLGIRSRVTKRHPARY